MKLHCPTFIFICEKSSEAPTKCPRLQIVGLKHGSVFISPAPDLILPPAGCKIELYPQACSDFLLLSR